jgi:hypothetical protein
VANHIVCFKVTLICDAAEHAAPAQVQHNVGKLPTRSFLSDAIALCGGSNIIGR